MSKKTISKVIAMVCVMALCLTAVFTGSVFADARTATATVTGYSYYEGAKDSYVSAEVTFTSSTAFTAGSLTFSATGLTLIDCSTATEGFHIYVNPANSKVLFAGFSESATNDIVSATSLTLIAKFSINAGALADQAAGATWTVNAQSITITNTAEETYTCANASGTIHVHNFNGATSTSGNVTTHACSVAGCSEVKTEISDTAALTTNNLAATRKAVLSFTADGDTVLNALVAKSAVDAYDGGVYFVYSYQTNDDLGNNITVTATSVATGETGDYYVFPCGRNGGVGRMGRNIKGNFIAVSGGNTTISADWEYSIKSYLEDVISGSYSDAEKNYAKALWNFGKYTAEFANLTNDYALFGADKSVANWTLPTSKAAVATGTDGSWNLAGVTVTTGYKPKMNLRFTGTYSAGVTVKVYDSDELVYSKEVVLEGDTLTVSDIPTKYLTGNIVIGVKNSAKTISYSFGKYAKARSEKSDAAVFQWMMNYAYYLNLKFA